MLGREKKRGNESVDNDTKLLKEKEIFGKYALKYGMKEKSIIEDQKQIDRQWYVYQKIKEKGLENTNVEKLIDLITEDIHHQYEIKSDVENKIGFLFAFCGVMLALAFEQEACLNIINIIKENGCNFTKQIWGIACLSGFLLSIIVPFISMAGCLSQKIGKPLYNDKDRYFNCAVDDKDMSFVYILDVTTNVWIANEKNNMKRSRWFQASLISTILMVVFLMIIIIVNSL